MSKNLIVYFSHNKENYVSGNIVNLKEGNMKVIVSKLEKIIDADVFEIQPLHEYPTIYGETTDLAKKEKKQNARPKIVNIVPNMKEYENIYLGYPNWWGTCPMIIMTFLESYDFSGKHIYPICTHEGSGMGSSEKDIQKCCPNSIVHKGLAIQGSTASKCDAQLKRWVQ